MLAEGFCLDAHGVTVGLNPPDAEFLESRDLVDIPVDFFYFLQR